MLAVDVLTVEEYGFGAVRDFLGSDVEYLRASIYELPDLTKERFDIVAFWGVLYHLRHPLLGIDSVATMARDIISIETVIADGMLPRRHRSRATSMFFRQNELNDDYTSWFAPTITCLEDWLLSAGLHSIRLDGKWPLTKPTRCLVTARKSGDQPEFERTSNERLLHVRDVQCGDDFPQMRSKHGEADIVES